ncbi:MAG: excinuclease subunit [Gammaproteobacteria bacterium]|jgi:excinuclease ABC subunit C|nr:excinuclease subunit [Gammaproteobacteria bacterium]
MQPQVAMNRTDGFLAFDPASLLSSAPEKPGVYRMYDKDNILLYVGKARNLKKRLRSYFRKELGSSKTTLLVSKIAAVQYTVTHSEGEALLLENTLIKEHKPRYNVLLRDDKSYPYLLISTENEYPRLDFHRGAKREKGLYFGPYPSTQAVRESLQLLQKLFRLRQCQDSFFRNRQRPCLQHQINRCSAPCVNYITPEDYQQDVRLAELFLSGKSHVIIDRLIQRMEAASYAKAYEQAGRYRDQIANLKILQESQHISGKTGNVDIVALVFEQGYACVELLSIRSGNVLGSKPFYPKIPEGETHSAILSAFLSQYYLNIEKTHVLPDEIILNESIDDADWIQEVLSQSQHKTIRIKSTVRGERARWRELAITNAKQALNAFLADKTSFYERMESLSDVLGLAALPERIECFDISHTQGNQTVASCVVFDTQGPRKADYRRFNIEGITPGDDYAAMHQALKRRYTKVKQSGGSLPDLLIIDGGKGQLSKAKAVLEELQITHVMLLGIAKGPTRKAGFETLYLHDQLSQPILLDTHSSALHLLQQVRDEAHRFAITSHRKKRSHELTRSILDEIPGIGAKRRHDLLRQFGGLQGLKRASVEDIAKTPGISRLLAEAIFARLQK